jgi:hypothetical protein
LTAKIGVNDKCDSHTRAPYTITSDSVQLVNENYGDVIKFYAPGQELSLSTEFYKYLWLPSIKSIFVIITIFWWLKSGIWKKVDGKIQSFDIVQEYDSPDSGVSDHKGFFRYRVNIEYTYNFAGQQFETKSVVIIILTILSVILFVGGGVYVFNKI